MFILACLSNLKCALSDLLTYEGGIYLLRQLWLQTYQCYNCAFTLHVYFSESWLVVHSPRIVCILKVLLWCINLLTIYEKCKRTYLVWEILLRANTLTSFFYLDEVHPDVKPSLLMLLGCSIVSILSWVTCQGHSHCKTATWQQTLKASII